MSATHDTADAPIGLWAQLREDCAAHEGGWTTPGFHAVVVHRLSLWLTTQSRTTRRLVGVPIKVARVFVRNVYSIEISEGAQLGRRVKIAHQGGIVIHSKAVIGDDCVILQNCTIGGVASRGGGDLAPVLGRRVRLGAGSVIAGPVVVGDGARIGPNAVVLRSVSPGSVVVAPAAREIRSAAS